MSATLMTIEKARSGLYQELTGKADGCASRRFSRVNPSPVGWAEMFRVENAFRPSYAIVDTSSISAASSGPDSSPSSISAGVSSGHGVRVTTSIVINAPFYTELLAIRWLNHERFYARIQTVGHGDSPIQAQLRASCLLRLGYHASILANLGREMLINVSPINHRRRLRC